MSIKRTDPASIAFKGDKLPIWDSSDPKRNPPALPMHPDSPNLASVRSGSPVRSMHSRNLSSFLSTPAGSIDDDKLGELLDMTKSIKDRTQAVEDSVREALIEFGGLAHRSRDNGVALIELKNMVNKSQGAMLETDDTVKDNVRQMSAVLDSQRDSQKALITVTDNLLESTRDINRQLKNHDTHFKTLLSKSSPKDSDSLRIADTITRQLEDRTNNILHVLDDIRNSIPDQDYLLDQLQRSIPHEHSSASGNALMADDLQELKKSIELLSISSNAKHLQSSIGENSTLVETLAQKFDRATSEQNRLSRTVADDLELIKAKLNASSSSEATTKLASLEASITELITSVTRESQSSNEKTDSETKEKFDQILQELNSLNNVRDSNMKNSTDSLQIDQLTKLDQVLEKVNSLDSIGSADIDKLLVYIEKSNNDKKLDTVLKSLENLNLNEDVPEKIQQHIGELMKNMPQPVDHTVALKELASHQSSLVEDLLKRLPQSSSTESNENIEKLLGYLKESSLESQASLTKFFGTVDEKLTEHNTTSSKTLTDIQADIRSLIDFQYGDVKSFGDQVKEIVTRLDSLEAGKKARTEDSLTQAEEQQKQAVRRAEEAEKLLEASQRENSESALKIAELEKQLERSRKVAHDSMKTTTEIESSMSKDNSALESTKRKLEQDVASLEKQKGSLLEDIGAMKCELKIRAEEFVKLEDRVAKFEEKLSLAILDRSKGILGSTALSIINNGTPMKEERKPLKAASSSKRNLSFAPEELAEELADVFDKENGFAIAKRGSPFGAKKNRSISLFVDH